MRLDRDGWNRAEWDGMGWVGVGMDGWMDELLGATDLLAPFLDVFLLGLCRGAEHAKDGTFG